MRDADITKSRDVNGTYPTLCSWTNRARYSLNFKRHFTVGLHTSDKLVADRQKGQQYMMR